MNAVGLDGVLASEAIELSELLELLREPILGRGLPAFSMLSIRERTD